MDIFNLNKFKFIEVNLKQNLKNRQRKKNNLMFNIYYQRIILKWCKQVETINKDTIIIDIRNFELLEPS